MLTQGAVSIDVQEWPGGAEAPEVVAGYVRAIGLRPEDSYGVLPAGDGLVFVYRDRPEYEAARAGALPAPDAEAIMDMFGLDARGQRSGAATLFVHRVRWPASPALFEEYRASVGVRPEDMYGFFPNSASDGGGACCLAYRDRPEYAAARDGLGWEALPSLSFPDMPDAPGASDAAPGRVSLDVSPWPRGRLDGYLTEMVSSMGLAPEDCYGLGANAASTTLWLARRG